MIQHFTFSSIRGTGTLTLAARTALVTERHSSIQQEHEKPATPKRRFSARQQPAVGRGEGSPCPGHETTNQLSDALTTTSTGKPPPTPPTCGKLDTKARVRMPSARMPRYETCRANMNILCQPAVHRRPLRPASQQATQHNQQNKNCQTHPISPNQFYIHNL